MIELTTVDREQDDQAPEEEDRIELFSIDGVSYSIPNKARPNVGLQYLFLCRTEGIPIAESWLAEEMMGREAYLALISFEDLDPTDYQKVVEIARNVVFGETAPKEPSKKASTRGQKQAKKDKPTTNDVSGS